MGQRVVHIPSFVLVLAWQHLSCCWQYAVACTVASIGVCDIGAFIVSVLNCSLTTALNKGRGDSLGPCNDQPVACRMLMLWVFMTVLS